MESSVSTLYQTIVKVKCRSLSHTIFDNCKKYLSDSDWAKSLLTDKEILISGTVTKENEDSV
jgi:hypothetical protein